MTYIVNESCIRCKIMDCVEVCPVDCFYEGENMLVIHPDECIDCGVCVPECPVDAIKPDTDPGLEEWLSLNAKYAKIWPQITIKKTPPADSKEWEGKPDKLQYFSPNPGEVIEAETTPPYRRRTPHVSAITNQCPLWVKSRHRIRSASCPLYSQKRTFGSAIAMSALCHKRTHALQQSATEWACSRGLNLPLDGDRKRESECRALTGLRLDPDPPPVHLNDAL